MIHREQETITFSIWMDSSFYGMKEYPVLKIDGDTAIIPSKERFHERANSFFSNFSSVELRMLWMLGSTDTVRIAFNQNKYLFVEQDGTIGYTPRNFGAEEELVKEFLVRLNNHYMLRNKI